MDNSQSGKIQPSDLVKIVVAGDRRAKLMGGPNTIYDFAILGNRAKEVDRLFGQANEALGIQNPGWERTYEKAAAKFEKITGFRPEAVYKVEDELRKSIELEPLVDEQSRPLSEGLSSIRRKIEG